jgi:hypothetical protein
MTGHYAITHLLPNELNYGKHESMKSQARSLKCGQPLCTTNPLKRILGYYGNQLFRPTFGRKPEAQVSQPRASFGDVSASGRSMTIDRYNN